MCVFSLRCNNGGAARWGAHTAHRAIPASSAGKAFTYKPIHRAPDCAVTRHGRNMLRMTLSPPAPSSDTDKLHALQRLDQFREWHSLDDKRFCLVCGKIITGRQIQVAGGTRGSGSQLLSCPTERCNSIPMDWVLPTDETLAVAETVASAECNVAPPMPADNGVEDGLTSRLKKLSVHFKLAF
jgi:hypothetical protein